jgi:membrane associated rhomboid family serine protease
MYQVEHVAGVTPAAFTGHSVGGLWLPLTLITNQFLHTNFWHVFLNMIFLLCLATTSRKYWDIGASSPSISYAVSAPLLSSYSVR